MGAGHGVAGAAGSQDAENRRYFGVSIAQSVAECPAEGGSVPLMLAQLVMFLGRSRCLDTEALFRSAANAVQVRATAAEFERHGSARLSDAHVAAALLKKWLRELPEPILGDEDVYRRWLAVSPPIDALEAPSTLRRLRRVAVLLPRHNRHALREIFTLLARLSSRSSVNHMNARAIAICFAPGMFQRVTLDTRRQDQHHALVMAMMVHPDIVFRATHDLPIGKQLHLTHRSIAARASRRMSLKPRKSRSDGAKALPRRRHHAALHTLPSPPTPMAPCRPGSTDLLAAVDQRMMALVHM